MGKFIHQSVSCVITTHESIFLVQRSYEMRHFPGYWAFPGGKIDKNDTSHKSAMTRELYEELGIRISHESLNPIGSSLTPEFAPYRFENLVFELRLENEQSFTLNDEHRKGIWVKKSNLDLFFSRKDILSIPMLKWFCQCIKNNQTGNFVNDYIDVSKELLKACYIDGVTTYMIPSRALPPARHTACLLIGDLLVDPAPCEFKYLNDLMKEWKKYDIQKIFVSHWHLDHHQFVPQIAAQLNASLYMSYQTQSIIESRWGDEYFKNVEVINTKDGDKITHNIQVVEHPGHALGQQGLQSIDGHWCFVSDVFQGGGSVVVESMSEYLDCLEDLILKKESTIFIPSHGLPIAGNKLIQKVLKHRLEREKQIELLYIKGMDSGLILKKIYPNLKEELVTHALKNIKGHLERIRSRRKS